MLKNQAGLNKYNISINNLSLSGKRHVDKLVDFYKSKAMKRADLRLEVVDNVNEFIDLVIGKNKDEIKHIFKSFTTPAIDSGKGGRPRKHVMSYEMQELYFGEV